MRLKSLEIQGFKTFPDKTKLSFEPATTCKLVEKKSNDRHPLPPD